MENNKINKIVNDIEVTVIIPVYNDGKNLIQAIESALKQKGVKVEIIVIDDHSSEDLHQILLPYIQMEHFVYIRNEKNLGVAQSRNIGLNNAKGEYIAYLDSDDWWDYDKLVKQLHVVEEGNADIVCTGRKLVRNNGVVTGRIIHVNNIIKYKDVIKHNSVACSSVLIRKELALRHPMHHDKYHEDYINWLEITREGHIIQGIDEPLLKYRLSAKGKSRNKLKSLLMTYESYRVIGINKISAFFYLVSHLLSGIKKYFL